MGDEHARWSPGDLARLLQCQRKSKAIEVALKRTFAYRVQLPIDSLDVVCWVVGWLSKRFC